ncbi:twin-arginine translocase TatA/TatE family subunit [Flavobacterium sp.]|jgi:sec-independent protein translocase protein TatA|uniref:Sec-independent protein translocase subunit TatA/TatB n=1 Tax=Flavobacterium sp. TaxID=239 RepID=UPI0038CFF4BC
MFGGEFFFILLVAFLLFGSKNLPEVVKGYAKIVATLKNATNEIKNEIQNSVDIKEIDASVKQITHSLTKDVEEIKSSVASSSNDFGKNILEEPAAIVSQIDEEIEEATGPIKRKM